MDLDSTLIYAHSLRTPQMGRLLWLNQRLEGQRLQGNIPRTSVETKWISEIYKYMIVTNPHLDTRMIILKNKRLFVFLGKLRESMFHLITQLICFQLNQNRF